MTTLRQEQKHKQQKKREQEQQKKEQQKQKRKTSRSRSNIIHDKAHTLAKWLMSLVMQKRVPMVQTNRGSSRKFMHLRGFRKPWRFNKCGSRTRLWTCPWRRNFKRPMEMHQLQFVDEVMDIPVVDWRRISTVWKIHKNFDILWPIRGETLEIPQLRVE